MNADRAGGFFLLAVVGGFAVVGAITIARLLRDGWRRNRARTQAAIAQPPAANPYDPLIARADMWLWELEFEDQA